MFGPKAPLMQEAGEGDGGGQLTPTQQGMRGAAKSVVQNLIPGGNVALPVLDLAENVIGEDRGLSDDADVQPAPEPEALQAQPTTPDTGGGKRIGSPTAGPAGKPSAKTPFTLTGTLGAQASPDVRAALASRSERIQQAQTLTDLVKLRAMGVSENALRDYAWVAQQDEQTARFLADTHFSRAQQRINELNEAVDDARKMRIDPYRWHGRLGRGGRTAAAFAALTGGFAAGHLNPNTALNLMDQAIERDIAAQEQDIKTEFLGLQQARGLVADEQRLFESQLQAMQQIRAMNYASTLGRIKAAQQNAITESHRLSLQVARDHYEVKLLEELARIQQQILQIEVNAPLTGSVKQIQRLKQQALALREELDPGMAGGQTLATGPVTLSDGTTAEQGMQEVGQTRETVPITGGPAEAPEPPGRARRVAQRTPRVARGPEAGETATSPEEMAISTEPQLVVDEKAGVSRPETPEEVRARVAQARAVAEGSQMGTPRTIEQAALKARAGALSPEDVANVVANTPELGVDRRVLPYKSYARWTIDDQGGNYVGVPTWDDGINAVAQGRPIATKLQRRLGKTPAGGMVGQEDAEIVQTFAPEPNPKFFPGGEKSAKYQTLKRWHEYAGAFPEVYERASSIGGEANAIHRSIGTFIVRQDRRGDEDAVKTAREEIVKMDRLARDAYQTARAIGEAGLSGMFPDGSFQIPGLTSADEESMTLFTMSIAQAMNFIKTHDPTARISDQDLKVGEKAAAAYKSGPKQFIDFVQRIFGFDLTQTRQAQNFLRFVAMGATTNAMAETYDVLVPSYESMQKYAEEAQAVENFMRDGTIAIGGEIEE